MDKESVLLDSEDRMDKALGALDRDFSRLRTGRASTGLVDNIKVDYYGTPTPISQLASVAIPDSRTITIQPWDRGAFAGVEKAILKSDLGLTPVNDGKIIRISIPPLTEDRRKGTRQARPQVRRGSQVAVRNVRRDANDQLRSWKRTSHLRGRTQEGHRRRPEADGQVRGQSRRKVCGQGKGNHGSVEVRAGRGGDHMKKVPFSPSRPLPLILLGFSADGGGGLVLLERQGKTLFRQISFERVSVSKVRPARNMPFSVEFSPAACRDIRP